MSQLHVGIDVGSLTSSLLGKMSQSPSMSSRCCIFKTPQILKRHNEKAYIPDAFSIGPFHHAKASLKDAEEVKLKYLQALINRSPNPTQKLGEMIKYIAEVEGEARGCYAPPIGHTSNEFVEILVLDGCFIIELFRRHTNKGLRDTDDPVFTMSFMLQLLYHDLCLLENQMPWFVLERLFHMTSLHPANISLVQLALKFFDCIFQSIPLSSKKSLEHLNLHESKHILDLLRNSLIFTTTRSEGETFGWQPLPSARILEEAGITFTRVKSSNILDIKFHNGVLEIPPLLIQETTETVFRNLICFEQCQPDCRPVITSYAILFDNLINTAKDVNILLEKGIIDNWLNLEDATRFFNKLYLDTYVKEYYFLEFNKQINSYCNGYWPRLRAYLVRNYILSPMGIVSQVAAFILNSCTVVQTFFKK
ncbi:hypothetical protein F2P56_000949 [Juglans regia]|uniref:UPF0481 protein At3g47200-like n=2 Tax=Juglans regia TaxID=51240 RepID=A0A6P9DV09_JUGRE|nr:UPF0481 protein At3g47200-like [Juglans regia]XP_035539096.1 UPF0481 protein At3g47200-like [Juglans regia]KAF5480183.1 hypothetical protein F2P56_000949 [Juglans regia]